MVWQASKPLKTKNKTCLNTFIKVGSAGFLRYCSMRKVFFAFLFSWFVGHTYAQSEQLLVRADSVSKWLASGQYDLVRQYFSPALTQKLDRTQLSMIWLGLYQQLGALQFVGKPTYREDQNGPGFLIPLRFEKKAYRLAIAFDSSNQINSFLLEEAEEEENWRYPAYGNPALYREFSMQIKNDTLILPAVLTLPKNLIGCPLVVFVHGLGPNDKDESQGPNKMFKDLAVGLASRGIASLRYDKRSLIYGPELMEDLRRLNIQTETIDDAVSAISLASKIQEIDTNRIFILGHGIGAMLAPEIAAQSRLPVRGLILVAPSTKPLAELIFEQYVFIAAENGFNQNDVQLLKMQEAAKKRALNPQLNADVPNDSLPLRLPASYWLSWQQYDPAAALWQNNNPLLVLSGDADYQVPPETLLAFRQKMLGREKISYQTYSTLNHFMMPASGARGPADYRRRNNVSLQVIEDISRWIGDQLLGKR